MKLWERLLEFGDVAPEQSKLHLASPSDFQDPFELFFSGGFDDWQRIQARRNFKRAFVVSLIQTTGSGGTPIKDRWLFAGVYLRDGEPVEISGHPEGHLRYPLTPAEAFDRLSGRLVVHYNKKGRQSYRLAETLYDELEIVHEHSRRFESASDFRTWHGDYHAQVQERHFSFQSADEPDDPETRLEGTVRRVLVNLYERDPAARRACLEHHGFRCQGCSVLLEDVYGPIAKDFIHVHHLSPVSAGMRAVDPRSDLVPLCPNCHAIVHVRRDAPLELDELRRLLDRARGSSGARAVNSPT